MPTFERRQPLVLHKKQNENFLYSWLPPLARQSVVKPEELHHQPERCYGLISLNVNNRLEDVRLDGKFTEKHSNEFVGERLAKAVDLIFRCEIQVTFVETCAEASGLVHVVSRPSSVSLYDSPTYKLVTSYQC